MCSTKFYIIHSICIQFVCMELSTFEVIIKIYLIVHVIFKYFPITCIFLFFIQLFRDHPLTIKKRFLSVLFMLIFSPLYTWYFIQDKTKVRFEYNTSISSIVSTTKIIIFRCLFGIGWVWNGMVYLYLQCLHSS